VQTNDTDPGGPPRKMLTRTKIKIVILLLLATLISLTIWKNWGQVETNLLFATVLMPRVVFVAIWLILGVVIGLITPGVFRRRREGH